MKFSICGLVPLLSHFIRYLMRSGNNLSKAFLNIRLAVCTAWNRSDLEWRTIKSMQAWCVAQEKFSGSLLSCDSREKLKETERCLDKCVTVKANRCVLKPLQQLFFWGSTRVASIAAPKPVAQLTQNRELIKVGGFYLTQTFPLLRNNYLKHC